MAKPIKKTPTLKGRDAINFHNTIAANKDKKVDSATIQHIQESAQKLRSILKTSQHR